jgi:salicylate hydroxylase/6-hydroxynicotinate 3-monooxygenase
MKGGNEDTSWLYGYDAWHVPLDAPAPEPTVLPEPTSRP